MLLSSEDQEGVDQISYILKKPEILKMHLEILYKSVPFISEQRIMEGIHEYKAKKERLRLEEEQRQHDSKSKKKIRARSAKEDLNNIRQNGSQKSHEESQITDRSKKEEIYQKQINHSKQLTPNKKITRSSKRDENSGESPTTFKSHKNDKRMDCDEEEEDLEIEVSADDSSS